MAEPTWKAVWAEIETTQAYDDGVELGLRLLHATRQHQGRLSARTYAASRMRLYRNILFMLDKAERWEDYLQAWDAILSETDLCLSLRGDAAEQNPALAPLVRRPDGQLGAAPRPYGTARPDRIEVHFLHTQLGRKAVVARRLAQGQRPPSSRPVAPGAVALTTEDLRQRLLCAKGAA